MSELARIDLTSEGRIQIAEVAGELDASNVDDLSEQLLESMSNESAGLVIDLSRTSYIDSSGISLIFDAAARVRNRRQQIRLVATPDSFVSQVLDAVSLGDSVPVDEDLGAAVAAIAA
jgi:anti-sigma B factor antagonist